MRGFGEQSRLALGVNRISLNVPHHDVDKNAMAKKSPKDLPSPKEWIASQLDCGGPSETNGCESADYVDGWNDALSAVKQSSRAADPLSLASMDSIAVEHAWTRGFATALAEVHRLLIFGNETSGVREIAATAGVDLAALREARVATADIRSLRIAGLPAKKVNR